MFTTDATLSHASISVFQELVVLCCDQILSRFASLAAVGRSKWLEFNEGCAFVSIMCGWGVLLHVLHS